MRWSVGRLGFKGMRPRRDTRHTGSPISVIDANLTYGDLRPFPCPEEICNLDNPQTIVSTIVDEIYCDCLTFKEHTSFVKDCELFFWNDETGSPMISTASQFCAGEGCSYGVQCPENPPVVVSFENAPSSSSITSCDSHFFAYRYAYIVEVGGREFEGHWSPPTDAFLANAIPNTVLSGIPNPGGCHTKVRIYRAASGFHSGESANIDELGGWFVVGTFGLGGSYSDSESYSSVQRTNPISPDEYASPPSNIRSLGITDNGVFFGISGNNLLFTLPGYPMSWSNRRKICIPENAGTPIKAVARGEDVYVYTDRKPVYLKGVVSQSGIGFDLTVIQKNMPLVSLASTTSGYMGEYFASTDGYYIWNGVQIDNLTIDWFSKEDWCKTDPSTISGAVVEDKLIWSTSVDSFMLIFGDKVSHVTGQNRSPTSGRDYGGNVLIGLNMGGLLPAATGHLLSSDNTLVFHKDGIVYKWDLCADIMASHHKEDNVVPRETCCPWTYCDFVDVDRAGNFNRGEIKFDIRTLTDGINLSFSVVRCGEKELIKQAIIKNCKPFTLPGCVSSEEYLMEATGCERVKHFSFASSLFQLIDSPLPKNSVELNDTRR